MSSIKIFGFSFMNYITSLHFYLASISAILRDAVLEGGEWS